MWAVVYIFNAIITCIMLCNVQVVPRGLSPNDLVQNIRCLTQQSKFSLCSPRKCLYLPHGRLEEIFSSESRWGRGGSPR